MDLSKMKVEVYDFLALIIPGLLLICEFWITLRGWERFAKGISSLSASGFTVLLFVAFALGPLVQEAADLSIKALRGERYFKAGRDHLWQSPTGTQVQTRIAEQLGHAVENVDVAFDYCLTRIKGSFAKRDLFVANSDLARSLMIVSCMAVVPLARVVISLQMRRAVEIGVFVLGLAAFYLFSHLCWIRMRRFRKLSELPVFHAYLAQPIEVKSVTNSSAEG